MSETLKTSTYLKTIAIDVDGVLNSYTSGWTDATDMPDAPNPGAMRFLKDLVDDGRFEVVIVSSRLNHPEGIEAVKVWIWTGLYRDLGDRDPEATLKKIRFSVERPPATVTIDDRAITFVGEWPSPDRLAAFLPWNKKPKHLRADPLTAVAAIDALMMRIGRIAAETGCPDGTPPLNWIEERARFGHDVARMVPAAIERISDEDLARIRGLEPQVRRYPETEALIEKARDAFRLAAARERYAMSDIPSPERALLAAEIDYLIAKQRYAQSVPETVVNKMPQRVVVERTLAEGRAS